MYQEKAVFGRFNDLLDMPEGVFTVMLGNAALALGVVHAGYRAAEGYPGTPSTEVIDTLIDSGRIDAEWSVNEAVAVGVGLGRSLAGEDVIVTMKTPGLFQAADVVSSAAFYDIGPGAMVLYVATDYEPSSTQNIVDARYFLASCGIPVLEPRNHQDLYEMPRYAGALSREMGIPVVILTAGVLAHSEGIVILKERLPKRDVPLSDIRKTVLLPAAARHKYDAMAERILPAMERRFCEDGFSVEMGNADWGVISVGASTMALKEALAVSSSSPHLLSLATVFPLPKEAMRDFAKKSSGGIVVLEEGGRYVEEQLRLLGIDAIGKMNRPSTTYWTPLSILELLGENGLAPFTPPLESSLSLKPVSRPPSICPGCPYRGITLILRKLKKQKRIDTVFGDIGCSTLMLFLDALDLNLCMGASESMRQGFVLANPAAAGRTVSLLGDSCECHTGLDASRNAVYRRIPGVKIVLDNRSVAMTGGQTTPTTDGRIDLTAALRGEGVHAVNVDAFDLTGIDKALTDALEAAVNGRFSAIVIRGECLQSRPAASKRRTLTIDATRCTRCGRCAICPGIVVDDNGTPQFTMLCRNCGGRDNVCAQRCRQNAIVERKGSKDEKRPTAAPMEMKKTAEQTGRQNNAQLPESMRLAVRGIGGQGNLFLGKVLANVFLKEVSSGMSIIKGETHGMAQLGGPVVSTFAWGNVHSAVFLPRTADVLICMETAEVLRRGFLDLLKPGGTLIFNRFSTIPQGLAPDGYPEYADVLKALADYRVLEIDAFALAKAAGDPTGMTANVAVIGLLSTIEPFSALSTQRWLAALDMLSKSKSAAAKNRATFQYVVQQTMP